MKGRKEGRKGRGEDGVGLLVLVVLMVVSLSLMDSLVWSRLLVLLFLLLSRGREGEV